LANSLHLYTNTSEQNNTCCTVCASIGHWRQNLAVSGEHHTVYALDVGFVLPKAPVSYNVEFWVEQVYDFWLTFIRQPVVLIGTIGSLVSAAAAKHPDMVQGVVMMSLPDPSLEEEAIPEFLRPVLPAIYLLLLHPYFKLCFGWFADQGRCQACTTPTQMPSPMNLTF